MNTTTYDTIGSYQFTDSNIGQPDGTIFINSAAHEQVTAKNTQDFISKEISNLSI